MLEYEIIPFTLYDTEQMTFRVSRFEHHFFSVPLGQGLSFQLNRYPGFTTPKLLFDTNCLPNSNIPLNSKFLIKKASFETVYGDFNKPPISGSTNQYFLSDGNDFNNLVDPLRYFIRSYTGAALVLTINDKEHIKESSIFYYLPEFTYHTSGAHSSNSTTKSSIYLTKLGYDSNESQQELNILVHPFEKIDFLIKFAGSFNMPGADTGLNVICRAKLSGFLQREKQ